MHTGPGLGVGIGTLEHCSSVSLHELLSSSWKHTNLKKENALFLSDLQALLVNIKPLEDSECYMKLLQTWCLYIITVILPM